jgi:hypothetical protein
MRTIVLIIVLVITFWVSIAFGQDIWSQANTAYDQGKFSSAIDGYRTFIERGNRIPEAYYNLGNAYFKDSKIGLAIASYKQCLKIDPSFIQAKENLNFVRGFVIDKVEAQPRGFLLNIWYGLAGILSPQANFVVAIAIYWIISALITLIIFGYSRKELVIYLLIVTAIVFIISVTIARFSVGEERNVKWGVVTTASVEIREGPGEEFGKIFTGHEGLEFRIISTRQNYCLVELSSGLKGWVLQSTLTEI